MPAPKSSVGFNSEVYSGVILFLNPLNLESKLVVVLVPLFKKGLCLLDGELELPTLFLLGTAN